jgi:ATP-dependent exoDNAse (exonuclease V) beta subunit
MDRPSNSHLPPARFDSELGPLVSLPEKFGEKRRHPALVMHRLSEKEEDLAETQRLFYVAATRAADILILSANVKQAGQGTNPWLKLLAERFDLLTGQPRQAPVTGGNSIMVKYSGRLPEIVVHRTAPQVIDLSRETAPRPPALNRFRELLDQTVADPLPPTLQVIPPDHSARRRISVSEIETIDAELCQTTSAGRESSPPLSKGGQGGAHGLPSGVATERNPEDSLRAEQLGHLVHAVLERIEFQKPQDVASLIADCCGSSERHIDEPTRQVAAACVENILESPLRSELASARQIHREIEFLLLFPPLRQGGEAGGALTSGPEPIVISGTIDCLFESADGRWTILDYKTGIRRPGAPAARLLAEYEIQLGLYVLAVEQLIHSLPDRIELVFMRNGVDRVVFEPTDVRLSEIVSRVARAIKDGASAESKRLA